MPGERGDERSGEAPRTDLPAERDPYYEGTFGTDEEEGVERERDGGDGDEDAGRTPSREAAEDAAGGDRGLL